MSNESSVEILSHSSYERCPGLWHIVGEVENTGKDNVIGLEMTAHLYDEGGKVIGFGFGFASVKVLEPGQRSPFKIVVSEAGFKHYELRAKFGTTIQNPYRGLKILMDDSHLDEFGHYRVTGRVKNEGDQDVTSVRVTGTFYDSEGTVIATESVDGNQGIWVSVNPVDSSWSYQTNDCPAGSIDTSFRSGAHMGFISCHRNGDRSPTERLGHL